MTKCIAVFLELRAIVINLDLHALHYGSRLLFSLLLFAMLFHRVSANFEVICSVRLFLLLLRCVYLCIVRS